ncbi:MAG: copper chaperone PCu(A)C [Rhodospirillaceae bacterium]|nr:copper chaperone PCu(A)C [Rhodospirillaceae bacterium]
MSRFAALAPLALGAAIVAAGLAGPATVLSPAQAQQVGTSQDETEQPPAYRLGDLTVGAISAHQSASRDGAAYLRIGNAGEDDDALIDASTPIAKRVELRGPVPGGEVWETGRVDAIPAPAGRETVLTAATLHLRLVGLRGILRVGRSVPITLTFERAGAITVQARILSPNEAAAIIEQSVPQNGPPGRQR